MAEITEYRGVRDLVYAEVITDDNESGAGHGYVTGAVKSLAGVAEISRTTESSDESHYYDNQPAIVVSSTGADEVTISASAIPLDVLADITGQKYDASKGCLIEGQRASKYFAIGYKTKKTNGDEIYVWRFKGKFNIPDQTNSTENDGTDANGQEIIFTGINTTHKFVNNDNKTAKSLNVDVALGKADVSDFFDEVTTPDTLAPSVTYSLSIEQASGTTVTVTRGGVALEDGADLRTGDVLTISCEGGTLEVNGSSFVSGNTHTVAGDVEVVSTAE